MDTQKSKPLTHDDTVSSDEVHDMRYTINEETARKMGYPSAKVYAMEVRLAELARQWHQTHDEAVLSDYHTLYYKMIVFGYSPEAFGPETEIETEHMPELPEKVADA
jgi:hypothetical protein